ncbi:MAG: hypothetical protein IJC47_00350 [Alistipes sp.]|nr:hypothetical protein [Alistipes sp.]
MKNSFYLFGMFTMCLLFSCSKAVNEPSAQMQTGSAVDEVADCALIRSLHAYNDSLYVAHNLARGYNPFTNEGFMPQTRSYNSRAVVLADALGALRGGWKGFRYGALFGPSGAVAGAAVGAILNGAVASAAAHWVENGSLVVDLDNIPELIASDSIFQPQPLYEMALAIEADVLSLQFLDVGLNMGPDIEAIGLAHNLLLDRMMGVGNSVNNFDPIGDGSDLPPDQPIITLSYIDALFEDEFTAEMVASEIFQQDFDELIEQQLEDMADDSMMSPSDDIPEIILGLCFEAVAIYENNSYDAAAVVNFYYNEVATSEELTEEEKTAIYAGLSVMIYSSSYWTEQASAN